MSEVDERIETDVVEIEPPRRSTLVTRALAPLRRVRGLEQALLVPTHKDFASFEAGEPKPRRKINVVLLSLILVVALPIVVSGVYLFFISTDQYTSEARFAVLPASPVASGASDMTIGTNGASGGASSTASAAPVGMAGGSIPGGQEASIVANYIHSRAIVDDISSTMDLRAIFQRPEADFVARLPKDASVEDLADYWNHMVTAYMDSMSGIVTVEVRAFRRDDALLLTKAVLKSSETLVNAMSNDMRADSMKRAGEELRRSEGLVRFALAEITTFRNAHHFVDPVKSSDDAGKLLLQLLGDKSEIEIQLAVTQHTTGPNAPGLNAVKAKLDSVNSQIASLRETLAGSKDINNNMASSLARFEELDLKRLFAERMYGFASDGLDRARRIAERQAIYLAVFVPPSLAQDSSYPLRLSWFSLIALGVIAFWSTAAMICASILDHRL